MNYNNDEVNHILYHNRSIELVKNFLPEFDVKYLVEMERVLIHCRELFINRNETNIEFDVKDFNFESTDIIFNKEELNGLIIDTELSNKEYSYLIERSLSDTIINRYNLFGLSAITDMTVLSTIGATTHPLLEKVLGDGISGGGIIFPLYENGQLENVAIRRLDNSNQMKYTLAIPDISIWGINDIKENSEIWLSEGLIDRIAMLENGFDNVISASTPGLSIIHLLKILDKKPSIVNIWSDKDQTGLKHAAIIQKFFSINNVACEVYISEESKDADDHFNRDGLTIDDIYPIKVTHERINSFPKNINGNFLEYLKGREF